MDSTETRNLFIDAFFKTKTTRAHKYQVYAIECSRGATQIQDAKTKKREEDLYNHHFKNKLEDTFKKIILIGTARRKIHLSNCSKKTIHM